jgi:para-aminobenzoate synthetase
MLASLSMSSAPRNKFCWITTLLLLSLSSSFLTKIESFFVSPPSTRFLSTTTITRISLLQSRDDNQDNKDPPTEDNDKKYNVSLLLIDHYDSFTYNLCDMLAQLTTEPPIVVAKDAIDSASLFDDENGGSSFFDQFDGIVLSPGPGTPQEQPPLSHLAISKNPDVPILGVCLGHQLMSLAYGGSVDRAPVPIHGQDHRIVQQGPVLVALRYPSLFRDLPSSFRVVRYHSLCAYDLPKDLTVTVKSLDDVVQGIQHVTHPHYGVQFHPESIGTENGMALLENFVQVVQQRKDAAQQQHEEKKQYSRHISPNYRFETAQSKSNSVGNVDNSVVDVNESTNDDRLSQGNNMLETSSSTSTVSSSDNTQSSSRFRVMVHKISSSPSTSSPLQVFEKYYARKSHTIWLDSSSYPSRGELDIMSTSSRPEDIIEYHLDDNDIGTDILSRLEKELFGEGQNSMNSYASDIGWVKLNARSNDDNDKEEDHVLEWVQENDEQGVARDNTAENLPFNYRGGFLGFLGYEVRHDTQRYLKRLERGVLNSDSTDDTMVERNNKNNGNGHNEGERRVPTAAFFLARQSMVYHHPTDSWFLIGLVEDDNDIKKNIEWMKMVDADLMIIAKNNESSLKNETLSYNYSPNSRRSSIEFVPNRPKTTYENDIAKCHEYIKKGDSYELCLTNKLEAYIDANVSTFDLYRIIRKVNPAPYSAYLRWNLPSDYTGNQNMKLYDVPSPTSLVICSSSPERFMSVSRQQPHPEIPSYLQAEAKPIKGTCARVIAQNGICLSDAEIREDDRRARSLELSLKNRAENLMIVDLLRNDMSRVCKTGTVHVSKLMDIESFATVHQMVSTIRGTLSDSNNSIDLLRASFPGGSMTGAPKIRTMEIIEELEQNVDRGPYAGSIGYLSVNGCMDMNIMIRSAAVTPSEKKDGEWKVSIGAGGAITALSDAEDEYEEMLLKARAVLESVDKWMYIIDDDKMMEVDDSEYKISKSTDIFAKS